MKNTKILTIILTAASLMIPAVDSVHARGGGGHFSGGGHGGWSGGRSGESFERGGGGFERGGGEFRGPDRPGEHGSGQRRDGGDGRHNRNNNNNNNNSNNTVNVYGNGGWGWGWGAADDALAGMAVGAAIGAAASQPSTIIVENQAPAAPSQQQAPSGGMPAIGTQVTVLPSGAVSKNVNGILAYECKGAWYRPYFGSSGVYYVVVSPPPQDEGQPQ